MLTTYLYGNSMFSGSTDGQSEQFHTKQVSDLLESTPCRWEYVVDSNQNIVYEKAYNNKKLIWGIVYSPPTVNRFTRQAHYVGPDGFPKAWITTTAELVEIIPNPTKIIYYVIDI